MDIDLYINSGVLESYALGLCSQQEAAEVENLCAQYPEVKEALNTVQATLNTYAALHSAEPHPETKTNVLNAWDKLEAQTDPLVETKVIALPQTKFFKRIAVAASLLFTMSLAANIRMMLKLQATEADLISLRDERNLLSERIQTNQVSYQQLSHEMALMTDPSTKKVMLTGVEKHPGMLAVVLWNHSSKEVFLEIKNLPMPEQGMQYQLWAIVDGKPMDAGLITMSPGDSTMHKMKDFDTAEAFAITLEHAGGSPQPDMEQMYMLGKIDS